MTFTVKIKCDNAAFEDYPHAEVRRILGEILEKLGGGEDSARCIDANGNTVGEWRLTA